jgi:hypothetical protein
MANFSLTFPIPVHSNKIEIGKTLLFMGSCFSDEIGNQAQLHGLNATANPFGTLFHPLAIGQSLLDALNDVSTCNSVQTDDVFFHWGSSGKIHGYSANELTEKVLAERRSIKAKLSVASHLFITFGTAKGYVLATNNQIVTNCHKQHPSLFNVEITTSAAIVAFWEPIILQLKELNPQLSVIFTVSPVRHLKDGIIENNRSKAKLLLAVETFLKLENCSYFPSYEIVMDELRDYRFFKNDFAHPNELAVEYVWQRFANTYLTESTITTCNKIKAIKAALNHKPLYEKSKKLTEHQEKIFERKKQLDKVIIGINWQNSSL